MSLLPPTTLRIGGLVCQPASVSIERELWPLRGGLAPARGDSVTLTGVVPGLWRRGDLRRLAGVTNSALVWFGDLVFVLLDMWLSRDGSFCLEGHDLSARVRRLLTRWPQAPVPETYGDLLYSEWCIRPTPIRHMSIGSERWAIVTVH